MSLNHFFTINLPYGIARNNDGFNGAWMAFNREYLPLGHTEKSKTFPLEDWPLPIYAKYSNTKILGIKQGTLLKIADYNEKNLRRDERGRINRVWLYNDFTNPTNHTNFNNKDWNLYCEKLKILSKLQII